MARVRSKATRPRLRVVREVRQLVQRLLADRPRVGGAAPVQRHQHLVVLVREIAVHQRQLRVAVGVICRLGEKFRFKARTSDGVALRFVNQSMLSRQSAYRIAIQRSCNITA